MTRTRTQGLRTRGLRTRIQVWYTYRVQHSDEQNEKRKTAEITDERKTEESILTCFSVMIFFNKFGKHVYQTLVNLSTSDEQNYKASNIIIQSFTLC